MKAGIPRFVVLVCGLVLGLGTGFGLGRLVGPDGDVTPDAERALPRGQARGSAVRTVRAACPEAARFDDLERENQRLNTELAAAGHIMDTLELEAYGVAPAWPDDVPDVLGPAGFGDQVRKAVDECQPGVDLIGVDCSEPPCLAVLREVGDGWWNQLVNTCPSWTEPYGSGTTMQSGKVDCGDGTTEGYVMLGSSRSSEFIDNPSPDDPRNGMKRMNARAETWRGSWDCLQE